MTPAEAERLRTTIQRRLADLVDWGESRASCTSSDQNESVLAV